MITFVGERMDEDEGFSRNRMVQKIEEGIRDAKEGRTMTVE